MQAKILNASAGSGKTYQLAYQYVRDAVEQPVLYRHILAVTFTNKATEEMKSRILKEIHLLASGDESDYLGRLCNELQLDEQSVRSRAKEVRTLILHDYSHFTVLTIDTFFQRILRAFIQELGIDLDYNIEIETESVLAKSADALIDQIRTDRELQQWMSAFVQERIDEGKRWDVRDGILSLGGEIFKESNRQSLSMERSKEELGEMVRRIGEKARTSREEFLHTGQSALDLMHRAGVAPKDFSGGSRSFTLYFAAVAAGEVKAPTKTARERSESDEGWCTLKSPSSALSLVPTLRPMLAKLCSLYDENLRLWNTDTLLRENYRSFALLADLYGKVREMCSEQNVMMLSETKNILSEFIRHNDAPFIYEKAGNRYDRYMIDEFQDTSLKEWENFLPLLRNAMSQSEQSSVLIVGDVKQSIYRWRGGDWKILHERATHDLGADHTEVVHLRENWRSLPLIVRFNNALIDRVVANDNRKLNGQLDEVPPGELSDTLRNTLRDTLQNAYANHAQQPRREGDTEGCIRITCYDRQPPLVERICALLDAGFRPGDMLILVRGKVDGARAAAALLDFKRTNRDPRYRFDVMTQEALSIGHAPITAFVTVCMRLALNPEDSLRRALYNQFQGAPFDTPFSDEELEFFASLRLLPPEEAFERIAGHFRLEEHRDQIAYLQALHEQVLNFSSGRIADLALFLKWWDEQGANRSLSVERSERAIEILTVHKAKGLEKPVVLIPYCNWPLDPRSSGFIRNIVWAEAHEEGLDEIGRFPVRFKKEMGNSYFSDGFHDETVYAHVDNINLLYVALTRAAESLHLFIPTGGKSQGANVGEAILSALECNDQTVQIGEVTGNWQVDEEQGTTEYAFGSFAGPDRSKERRKQREKERKMREGTYREEPPTRHLQLDRYPTFPPQPSLRLPSQRYFEEEEAIELAPRNFGILMHRVFEQCDTLETIERRIREMVEDGEIDPTGVEQLRQEIDRALSNPVVHDWFEGDWEVVRNEQEIIVPGSGSIRRPDRVMTRGEHAVVVDYKFGGHEAEKYRHKLGEYMQLLRRIGYRHVDGYLWYVRLGRIEAVSLPEELAL